MRKKVYLNPATGALISRQRAWQIRNRSEGKCRICNKDAGGHLYCEYHAKLRNDKRRLKYQNGPHEYRGHIRSKPRMKVHEFHGMSRTRLYSIWIQMRYRCYSPKHISYPWYGGKGVHVCEEWFGSFIAFRSWALSHGYADNLTIDRKDTSRDYSPENCRWLTKSQNNGHGARPARKAS